VPASQVQIPELKSQHCQKKTLKKVYVLLHFPMVAHNPNKNTKVKEAHFRTEKSFSWCCEAVV
jgi:hypothetical protein